MTHAIPAGDIVPDHTHQWPAGYYTISFSDFIRRDQDGNVLFDSRGAKGVGAAANWIDCLPPHSVENVGANEIRLISWELKTL